MQLRLEEIIEQVEHLINATPSGEKRNRLCDANILLNLAKADEPKGWMTAYRFEQMKLGARASGPGEQAEYERQLAAEARSNAAKRAVYTKRVKYTEWPTRAKTHKVRAGLK